MKPIYVVLIAIASALVGGVVGAGLGGVAGGVAGGAGGTTLGFKYGICTATDIAKTQKLLTPAKADQLSNLAYTQANQTLAAKGLSPLSNQDCQTTRSQIDSLAK
jgi:outer membrane lipoprotein SlyB